MDWGGVGVVWRAAQEEEASDTRNVCGWWGGWRRGEVFLCFAPLPLSPWNPNETKLQANETGQWVFTYSRLCVVELEVCRM